MIVSRVFISHSSKDRAFVEEKLVRVLQAHGFSTWYAPDDLRTSDEFERIIVGALQKCEWFLVVVTKNSVKSDWVRTEVSWAVDYRPDHIIIIRLDSVPPEDLYLRLRGIHYVDFRNYNEEVWSKLLDTWDIKLQPAFPRRILRKQSHFSLAVVLGLLLVAAIVVADTMPIAHTEQTPFLTEDFSTYTTGAVPNLWDQFGTSTEKAVIEEVEGVAGSNKVLGFPGGQTDKYLIRRSLSCRQPIVTVKLHFLNIADAAGIIIGWIDNNNHISITPNIYWKNLGFNEWVDGDWRTRVETDRGKLQIFRYRDYLLRARAFRERDGSASVSVHWADSGNEQDLRHLLTVPNIRNITGAVGLGFAGPNLPKVYFDDFSVQGGCSLALPRFGN